MDKKQKIIGNYYWNLNGEIEVWEEDILTHIRVTDENDELITFLDVRDCEDDEEIHLKMMESFWDYYHNKNEETFFILKKIIARFPYFTQEEHKEFFEKVLNKREHSKIIRDNKFP